MKKIIASISIIAAAGSLAAGGTFALFSDSESSTGNSFAAGTLNLTFNGQDGAAVTPLFSLTNLKPSDTGTTNIVLANTGSVAGTSITASISGATFTGTCTEPEVNDDAGNADDCAVVASDEDSDLTNELDESVAVSITDLGADALPGGAGADEDTVVATGTLSDLLGGGLTISGGIAASGSRTFSVDWSIANTVGNEIQNDGVSFALSFTLNQ
ncbi:MAG TPA: TasA family protein [Patescibacteria group bacterium]|nr:TasA family protein [Patescibacteria group bacterium]